jgi:hypothetical protein
MFCIFKFKCGYVIVWVVYAHGLCVFLATLADAYPGCDSPRSAFGNDNLMSIEARRRVLQQRYLQLLDGCSPMPESVFVSAV